MQNIHDSKHIPVGIPTPTPTPTHQYDSCEPFSRSLPHRTIPCHTTPHPCPPRLAAFALEEFETALEAFRRGQAFKKENEKETAGGSDSGSDPRKYRTWIRKCEAELEAEEEAQQAAATAAATDRGVPTSGEVAPVSGGSVGGAGTAGTAKRTPVLASSSAPAHLRIKFQYYQSYEKVTVAVLEKGLKESEVDVEVEAQRLTVRRKGGTGSGGGGGALLFDKMLYEEVLPEKCRKRFMASKVGVGLVCCVCLGRESNRKSSCLLALWRGFLFFGGGDRLVGSVWEAPGCWAMLGG